MLEWQQPDDQPEPIADINDMSDRHPSTAGNHPVLFIGDCHGKIDALYRAVSSAPPEADIYQVGDMGIGFPGTNLPKTWPRFWFIRGNHDDPAASRAHPKYLGEYGYVKRHRMFYVGGGFSIDYEWRQKFMAGGGGPVWWPDEELSQGKLDQALKAYAKAKPLLMMTHECPAFLTKELISDYVLVGGSNQKIECQNSRTALMLEKMFQIHKPKFWVFGHYHVDRDIKRDGTRFHCCAELSGFLLHKLP